MNSSLYGRPLGNVTFPVCCRIVREGFYYGGGFFHFPFIQADLHIASGSSHQLGRNPSTFLGTSSRHKIPEIVRTNHSKLKPNLFSVSVSPFGNTDVDKYEAQLAHSFLLYSQPTPHPQAILGARSHFSLLTTTSPPPSQTKNPQ